MKKFLDILLDSFLDSLKILPILILVYFLIEFIEYKRAKNYKNFNILNKKTAPLIGAVFGTLPQCGFSVIATDLYTKKKVGIGALISVYIATSDEAIPIMLSNIKTLKVLIPLILIKIAIAIVVGYIAQLLYDKVFFKKEAVLLNANGGKISSSESIEGDANLHDSEHDTTDENERDDEEAVSKSDEKIEVKIVEQEEHEEEEEKIHLGCCHHHIEAKKFEFLHPLLHSLKIVGIILLINIIFGCIIEYGFKGEENLMRFLTRPQTFYIQPILSLIIGLIPNCASSVVLTELYLLKGLSFGSLLAGLIVNAGLGLILLLKQDKKFKEIVFIFLTLIITGLLAGYILHFII